jgi:GNAT superfamily N-acetyltransferase
METSRGATLDDIPRLVELHLALRAELREMRGGSLWEVRESRVPDGGDAIAALLARDDVTVVVGTIDDVVVGYGTLEIEGLPDGRSLGVVGDIYVEPGARAIGIGELMAEQLLVAAADAGCVGVDAFALPGHREAKNFFERNGFTARALIMHKPLTTE